MGDSQERIRRALDKLLYLPHLQAQHAEPSLPVAAAASGSGAGGSNGSASRGRPWDRGDLFRRLATFKSGTWFCKPQAISPVECARRGWTNTGPDLLTCEFCKAKLSCPIAADLPPEDAAAAGQRHAERLASAHDAACPWRAATSATSLLQFPPLTQEAVRRDFEARCAAVQRLLCLPPLAGEPLDTLAAAASPQRLAQLLLQGSPGASGVATAAALPQPDGAAASAGAAAAGAAAAAPAEVVGQGVALLGSRDFEARARVLALCGWDLKVMMVAAAAAAGSEQGQQAEASEDLPLHVGPESAALQCSLCAAKAGLWAFFPQCKPHVLPAPRRRGLAGSASAAGAAAASSAGLAKSAASRNVATDIATTIAGGTMLPGAGGGPAASPFGAAAQHPAAFGALAGTADGAAAQNGAATAAGSEQQQAQGQGEQQGQPPAAAGPFGGGSHGSSVPVFGFAALQASAPPAAAGGIPRAQSSGGAGGASIKRKQPDFSWSAVMADIEAKAAAEKRSRAAIASGTSGSSSARMTGASPSARATAANGRAGQPASNQQRAAAAAAAAKYRSVEASPLDPLALHRPFCPWVNCAGEKEGRCGWRWCLQQLAAAPTAAESAAAASAADDGEGEGSGSGREWDPAKLLRQVLQQVDVHK
ncbi:hypothetical protein ABPG75_011471 [Micractinium tetrahymenae]